MTRVLLSTFLILSILVMGTAGTVCKDLGPVVPMEDPYLEVFDRAIALYFKHPRRPGEALQLMKNACDRLKEERALACYNLGLLFELEGNQTPALKAYRRAWRLKAHPVFKSAIESLSPDDVTYSSAYLKSMQKIITLCRTRKTDAALKVVRQLLKKSAGVDKKDGPPRSALSQPFLKSCFSGYPEYEKLIAVLPEVNGVKNERLYYQIQARRHPFFSLWDMELQLNKSSSDGRARKKTTRAWADVLKFARARNGGKTASALGEFFKAVNRAPTKTADRSKKQKAMKRAAALLIQNDRYFAAVRGNGRIQAMIRPFLR